MSDTAGTRRGVGPGRLDPTVRALLRAFLSPTVADRYASALQPIAVADRDAAVAGAVSTLRARFFVLPEELAIVLVEDTGWTVADTSTLLGLPTLEVRAALRDAAIAEEPRVGTSPPEDLAEVSDEAALVDELMRDLPTHRRDPTEAADHDAGAEPVDVELSTTLPRHVALPSLESRIRRSDRIQRITANATVVAIVVLVALTVQATRPADEVAVPGTTAESPGPTPSPSAASPTPSPEPTAGQDDGETLPVGPVELAAARFVASVDPGTGEPGPTVQEAPVDADPRLWLRFSQLPRGEVLLELRFTAPSGTSTVRPVLLTDRTPRVSLRLPDELGRAPGRYAAEVAVADAAVTETVELELVAPADPDDG